MARIIVQGIAGELSGKLGGDVFARNRAGAYVRKNANVINPNTVAQIRARTQFGAAASLFHTLTPAEKTQWQNFANTQFVSKKGDMPGSLSGFNAFVSCRNTIAQMNAFADSSLAINEGATPCTFSQGSTTSLITPPAEMPSEGLIDSVGDPVPIAIKDVSIGLNVLEIESVTFGIKDLTAPPTGGTKTTDSFNSPFGASISSGGFFVYMSNAMKQEGLFVNNPEEYLIGTTGIVSAIDNGSGAPIIDDLSVTVNVQQSKSDYQQFPRQGDTVMITVYQVSSVGTFRKVGSEIVNAV